MKPAYQDSDITLYCGDARKLPIAEESVQCCVTSPPYYGLRDYGADGQIGLEPTPEAYVAVMVDVFREVRRVLKSDGVAWLNLGDSYAPNWSSQRDSGGGGLKDNDRERWTRLPGIAPKQLLGIPWRVAFALQADGWWLRQDIIWHKPNPMPESVTDRCTKSHEYIFLLAKSDRYFYDADAVKERGADSSVARLSQDIANQIGSDRANGGAKTNGRMKAVGQLKQAAMGRRLAASSLGSNDEPFFRNRRSVWTVSTKPYAGAHFATYPPALIKPCILAGSKRGDTILDPFNGSGTTGVVSRNLGRKYVGMELNPEYVELARQRWCRGGLFAQR